MSTLLPPGDSEWLEPDGLGDFASGTVSGVRTRRYHGLLIPATKPPAGRTVPVNGLEAWVESAGTTFAISAQRYYPNVIYPYAGNRLTSFQLEPWPTWTFQLNEIAIQQELFAVRGTQSVVLSWKPGQWGNISVSWRLSVNSSIMLAMIEQLTHENTN